MAARIVTEAIVYTLVYSAFMLILFKVEGVKKQRLCISLEMVFPWICVGASACSGQRRDCGTDREDDLK